MNAISATKAKQQFAALLDAAQRGPVHIQRHERDVAVVVSAEEFRRMQADAASAGGYGETMMANDPSSELARAFLSRSRTIRAEQEKRRATLSAEEYEQERRKRFQDFNRLAEIASAEAKANGLTEEILAEILAER